LSASASKIRIQLPSNLITSTTTLIPGQGFSSFTVNQTNNTFELSRLFSQDFISGKLSLTFLNLLNPDSAQPIKGLSISTFDNFTFLVDETSDPSFLLYTMLPTLFFSARVSADTTYAYTKSVVTFELTLADPLKPLSTIKITVPPEISITSPLCTGVTNL
jgi:hypothetical protein